MTHTSPGDTARTLAGLADLIDSLEADLRVTIIITPTTTGDTATVQQIGRWIDATPQDIPAATGGGLVRRVFAEIGRVRITALTSVDETPTERRRRLAAELASLDAAIARAAA